MSRLYLPFEKSILRILEQSEKVGLVGDEGSEKFGKNKIIRKTRQNALF